MENRAEIGGGTKRAFGFPEITVLVGALAILVSVFLYWNDQASAGALYEIPEGSMFFILAAIMFGAFTAKSRGILPAIAFIGLGFVGLALIGNFSYYYFDNSGAVGDLREGFYLAGIGSLAVLIGGILKAVFKK